MISFVVGSLYFTLPSTYSQAATLPGWFLTKTDNFAASYGAAMWVKDNVKTTDLILNDRSQSCLYIAGFSTENLVYSFWDGTETLRLKN